METFLSILIGVGLSAACGFRVFVPLLVASLAAKSGHLVVADGFSWLASNAAVYAFAAATVLEIAGYYIPWVDNLLDAAATPAAVIAGILLTASAVTGTDPFLHWTLAIVAGGGAAAVFQGLTAATRQVSTWTTGGLGNPLVATAEAGGAALLSVTAVALPWLAFALLATLLFVATRRFLVRRPAPRPT
jgi:hypothetical protein